MNQETCKNN